MTGKTPIEDRVAKQQKRQRIQDAVLAAFSITAGLGVAMIAPNSLQLLRYVEKHIGPKDSLDRRLSQAVTRLKKRGLVVYSNSERGPSLRLTKKGLSKLESLQKGTPPGKPRKWDGKWRMVIFDVWERRRKVRNQLRAKLQEIGFTKIQDSVWVYPYDCEEFFTFLRLELRLGRGMLYIVADEIEHDIHLRRHFNLPSR